MDVTRPKKNQTNVSIDPEAVALMRQIVGGSRQYGRYLSILIHRDWLRRQHEDELARVQAQSRVAPVTV